MNEARFVHLRMHSEYSISDSIIKIPLALSRAFSDNQVALGLTDLGNTFAFLKFYREARKKGIKPILGIDMWIKRNDNNVNSSRILLLCKSDKGYKRLCRLISKAWLNNSLKNRAEIEFDWLNEKDDLLGGKMSDGLICLSGGLLGEIGQKITRNSKKMDFEVRTLINKYKETFDSNFYLEVHRTGFPEEEHFMFQE